MDGAAGRNLTDPVDGCLRTARYLIHDRDPFIRGSLARLWRSPVFSRFGYRRRVPISTPMPNGSSGRSKRSVSRALSRSVRGMYGVSSTSTSNITIARETTRDSTTSSYNGHHLREGRTPTFGGGYASEDYSASTIERPYEGSAD